MSLAVAPALCCYRRLIDDLDPHRIVRKLKAWAGEMREKQKSVRAEESQAGHENAG